jgi:hypothetical protein
MSTSHVRVPFNPLFRSEFRGQAGDRRVATSCEAFVIEACEQQRSAAAAKCSGAIPYCHIATDCRNSGGETALTRSRQKVGLQKEAIYHAV